MADTRFAISYGAGLVMRDEPAGDIPLVRVGTVYGVADEQIDGDDEININGQDWNYADINGVKHYSVDQHVIHTMLRASQAVGPSSEVAVVNPAVTYGPGILRVTRRDSTYGTFNDMRVHLNGVFAMYSGGRYEYATALPLQASDSLSFVNNNGSATYTFWYYFLPYVWPVVP